MLDLLQVFATHEEETKKEGHYPEVSFKYVYWMALMAFCNAAFPYFYFMVRSN